MRTYAIHKDIKSRLEHYSISALSGCIIWTGAIDGGGYGRIRLRGRLEMAHRMSFIVHNGDIPEGMLVCHSCDVRPCINPNHLFLGTNQDNLQDASRKGKLHVTVCKNGHPATPENRYVYPEGDSYCKACRRKTK